MSWQREVRLRATAAGVEPRTLEPGRDLVLDLAREQAVTLPVGVLLDDFLPRDARERIDQEAFTRLAAWRKLRDDDLTLDDVCLPHIWEVELLAEVFLPETRIVSGLRTVFADGRPRPERLVLAGIDAERCAALRGALAPMGVEVGLSGPAAAPPRYPGVLASPWQVPLSRRIARPIFRTFGVPQRVRGDVVLIPYWHLAGIFERLTLGGGVRFVVDPASLPAVSIRALVRSVVRGGWLGHPNVADRRRSRRESAAAIGAARDFGGHLDPLQRFFDARALTLLEQRAGETLAVVRRLRRAFAKNTVKLVVLPNDSMPDVRSTVQAARDTGVSTLVVQHGFLGEPNDPDKTLADAVAVWAESDARRLETRGSGRLEVTGNPGAAHLAALIDAAPRPSRSGSSIVLVEYASRLSCRSDGRVSVRHVDAALRGLAEARAGTEVVIRPHPAEHEPEIFGSLAVRYPGIDVRVDSTSSIANLVAQADLCVAAVSTAALEAAAAGVPVIFLSVTGNDAPWPFDGSTGVPVVSSAEELAALIPSVLASTDVPGRAEMLDALGVRADAVNRVIDLMKSIVRTGSGGSS